MRPVGELTELPTENFEIFPIYPYGELVFFFRRDLFQQNIGLPTAVSRRGHLVWNKRAPIFGVTSDLALPIWQHRSNAAGRDLARKAAQKWRRAWKLDLIERHSPQWRYLYDELAI
jgi:predicted GIY-YIG superfamily endonuclease